MKLIKSIIRTLSLFLSLLLLTFSLAQAGPLAQFPPLWTLTRNCAPDPITPPEGWSFPGVIISSVPDDGIRGLRATTMQTYYIAFTGSNFTEGGALSPDGKWYAVPYGYIQMAASSDERYIVQELRVMSTETVPRLAARMAWKASFQVGAIQPIRWLDNDSFVFAQGSFLSDLEPQVVHPFEQTVEPGTSGAYQFLAPDLTRGFKLDGDVWGLYDLTNNRLLRHFPALTEQLTIFRWSPDSAQFAAVDERTDADARILQLYGREGSLTANIADVTLDRLPWNFSWSPDGRQLVYSAYDPYKNENTLYIGDLATKTVTDTCVLLVDRHEGGRHGSGVIWSPDSTQLALITSIALDDPNAQQIMDVASGTRYGIGVYAGGYIGWGAE